MRLPDLCFARTRREERSIVLIDVKTGRFTGGHENVVQEIVITGMFPCDEVGTVNEL